MADPAKIISDGAVTALTALLLTDVTVLARKFPNVKEGDEPPIVFVSLLAEHFVPATAEIDYAYDGFWPVLVTIAVKTPGLTADPDTIRDWRWRIRRTMMEFTLPNSGVIIDGPPEYEGRPPFDNGASNMGYDYSPQLFVYRTQEARG